jgi:cytochrome P450
VSDARQSGSSDNYGDSVSPFVRFGLPYERSAYIISPHTTTSFDPKHWTNPQQFDPGRYRDVPTSAQVDEAKSKQIGFAKCPFDLTTMKVADGRNAAMANSAFGTVFGVVDGKPLPVCDYAGFAPFGFGYRRCPGEQLTIQVFEDFLRKVWRDKIVFHSLNLPNPQQVPIGPSAVIDDNVTFARPS